MRNFLGQDGFIWWVGVVEDINDPLTLGRCRVRIFGYHSAKSKNEIPTNDLPWAVAIHPLNTPNLYGAPKVNDWVFGFFLDGNSHQEPAMLGYFPAIPQAPSNPFGITPTANNLVRNFASVTQKDSMVLDVNGVKIEIANNGNLTITANNISMTSKNDITFKDSTVTIKL